MTMTRCPACHGDQTRIHGRARGFELRRCPTCDLVFGPITNLAHDRRPLFGQEYFSGQTRDGYRDYLGEERALRRHARAYLRLLRARAPGARTLFDAGCATGFLLDEARGSGWEVSGCDLSPWAAARARETLGLDVVAEPFTTVDPPPPQVDVLTMLNLLEHCPDPHEVAARCLAQVRPGGLLMIETWDRDSLAARLEGSRWHQWHPERVVTWFNRRSLCHLFPSREWEWLQYGAGTKWISLARGFEVLGLPRPASLASVLLPYRLGDLVMAVLRRRAG